MSDGLTGILSSFISLGCGMQIFTIFLENKRPAKRWVTTTAVTTELAKEEALPLQKKSFRLSAV